MAHTVLKGQLVDRLGARRRRFGTGQEVVLLRGMDLVGDAGMGDCQHRRQMRLGRFGRKQHPPRAFPNGMRDVVRRRRGAFMTRCVGLREHPGQWMTGRGVGACGRPRERLSPSAGGEPECAEGRC